MALPEELELDARLSHIEDALTAASRMAGYLKKGWDAALHPRGRDGQFIEKGGFVTGSFTVTSEKNPPGKGGGGWKGRWSRAEVVGFKKGSDGEVWVGVRHPSMYSEDQIGWARASQVTQAASSKAVLEERESRSAQREAVARKHAERILATTQPDSLSTLTRAQRGRIEAATAVSKGNQATIDRLMRDIADIERSGGTNTYLMGAQQALEEMRLLRRRITAAGQWDELLHPRGNDGKFIDKGGFVSGLFDLYRANNGSPIGRREKNRAEVIDFEANPDDPSDPIVIISTEGGGDYPLIGRAPASTVSQVASSKAELISQAADEVTRHAESNRIVREIVYRLRRKELPWIGSDPDPAVVQALAEEFNISTDEAVELWQRGANAAD